MKVSNCCGVSGGIPVEYLKDNPTHEECNRCPKCGKHCEYIEETTFETINTENEQDKDNKLREVL
jgi:hypothetical protein